KKVYYSKTILLIEERLKNTGTWDALFADSSFIHLYENSSICLDSANQFISNNKYTDHQKIICIYSLQRADLNTYVRFFATCEHLFEDGKLQEVVIKKALTPTFGKRKIIVENYNNKTVVSILKKLKESKKAPSD